MSDIKLKMDTKDGSRPKEPFRVKAQQLAGIVFADPQLQGVVRAWPEMSEQARHICTKLAGLIDNGE